MDSELREIIRKVRKTTRFFEFARLDSVNAVNGEGENMLHAAVFLGDLETARILIGMGINIEQPGDIGHTPLHDASSKGDIEMVKLLVEAGADVHALDEGVPPFTLARYGKHTEVCDYLGEEMRKAFLRDPSVWKRARVNQLRGEIARLEQGLERQPLESPAS